MGKKKKNLIPSPPILESPVHVQSFDEPLNASPSGGNDTNNSHPRSTDDTRPVPSNPIAIDGTHAASATQLPKIPSSVILVVSDSDPPAVPPTELAGKTTQTEVAGDKVPPGVPSGQISGNAVPGGTAPGGSPPNIAPAAVEEPPAPPSPRILSEGDEQPVKESTLVGQSQLLEIRKDLEFAGLVETNILFMNLVQRMVDGLDETVSLDSIAVRVCASTETKWAGS
ncbi:hypothetical protein ABW19_dt0207646 [Dactylella cylindrospora]|nr:hypothetical protein ABW19_dt0207646 [Dactylella cylindrospora]